MYKGERFNSISHLIGTIAALAGSVLLVVLAVRQGDWWKIISFSIYGVTLFSVYLCSTLYHSLQGEAKKVLRKFDHYSIYLKIAGTYTPFTLVTLRGSWGWSILGIILTLAIVGITLELLHPKENRILPVVIYLLMGWLILLAFHPLLRALSLAGFALLLLGGVFYTVGVVFYLLGKKVHHFHSIWHLFVLAGSLSHYLTVLFYVA